MAKDNWVKKLKKKVAVLTSEVVMGKKRYLYSERRKEEIKKITASRRRLNKIKEQVEKTDKKIGERLKNIDRLHKERKRLIK